MSKLTRYIKGKFWKCSKFWHLPTIVLISVSNLKRTGYILHTQILKHLLRWLKEMRLVCATKNEYAFSVHKKAKDEALAQIRGPCTSHVALAPQWNWTLNNMVLKTWFKVLENPEALAPLFVALAQTLAPLVALAQALAPRKCSFSAV